MADDDRWTEVAALYEWFAIEEDDDGAEFVRRWQRYVSVLEAIAADRVVASDERQVAQELLNEITAYMRSGIAPAVQALSRISQGGHDRAVRRSAHERLRLLTQQMREHGTDIAHWVAGSDSKQ